MTDKPTTGDPTPCLFVPPHEPFYCRIHAEVRLALTDERCRRAEREARPVHDAPMTDAHSTADRPLDEEWSPCRARTQYEIAARAWRGFIVDRLATVRTPATPDALREALVEALRTAHRPHQPTCAYDRYPGNYAEPPDPCTCGLDDLMDRALNGPGLSAEGGR